MKKMEKNENSKIQQIKEMKEGKGSLYESVEMSKLDMIYSSDNYFISIHPLIINDGFPEFMYYPIYNEVCDFIENKWSNKRKNITMVDCAERMTKIILTKIIIKEDMLKLPEELSFCKDKFKIHTNCLIDKVNVERMFEEEIEFIVNNYKKIKEGEELLKLFLDYKLEKLLPEMEVKKIAAESLHELIKDSVETALKEILSKKPEEIKKILEK